MKGIEYVDKQWSPVSMKCTPVSEGCAHCWALRMAKRLAKNPSIHENDRRAYAGQWIYLNPNRIEAPLHWRKPCRVAVEFMGDLFHEDIPDGWIFNIFKVMGGAFWHKYFLLTKRPERIAKVFERINPRLKAEGRAGLGSPWSHVWLGVTVCNQAEADTKIPELLKIPGFKKWISYEPALGPVDFRPFLWDASGKFRTYKGQRQIELLKKENGPGWIVAGAETGPGARPADPEWFRSLRDQAQAAGVPFFLKRLSDGSRELDGRMHEELPE